MRQSEPSFFLTKNTGAPLGDLDGWMQPFARFSQRKLSSSFCSAGDRGNVWEQGSSVPGERPMAWSHAFHGGSSSKASLEKTSLKSWYWAGVSGRTVSWGLELLRYPLCLQGSDTEEKGVPVKCN